MLNLDSPQWKRAQQTSLWKRTLGSDKEDVKPLRESFLDARENAAVLLDKISPDFPNLTIHDITHVDSLWSVADAIIGEAYPINPLEGFVLGIAFLIHDAALSYDAVGGKDKLRNTTEWKDAFAEGSGEMKKEEFLKECDFIAIRAIHAREAAEIMNRTFFSDDMPSFYIVKKASYRQSLGEIIGKIAASHHWSIDEIESKLDIQINPSVEISGTEGWSINAQKLACILRCADAGHIDDGRAPYHLYRSLNLNGVSLEHWKYQSHLGIVMPYEKDTSKLLITSTYTFKKKDFDAWNVAYEAVKLFDEEIKKSNELLKSIDDKFVFPRTGVVGANSKEELAEHIKTDGWRPCTFGIHTSNIKLLIENLAGRKLYGEHDDLLVVLRELIQNARDAIHARQKLEDSFENGKIVIRQIVEGGEHYIEVEDNGIGMSMDCIKYSLFDFGRSYWKSSLSKYENPGLRSKGFVSIGQFGIGFYSVFMVASSVDIYTKRYDKGIKDAKRVEFPKGLTLSPIISDCELESGVSTIVRINLNNYFIYEDEKSIEDYLLDLSNKLHYLVAGIDADVYWNDNLIHKNITSPNFDREEWLRGLYKYNNYYDSPVITSIIANNLEFIHDEKGNLRGLVCIADPSMIQYPSYQYLPPLNGGNPFLITNRGLWSFSSYDSTNSGLIGYIDCQQYSLSRNSQYMDKPIEKALSSLFLEKYAEIRNRTLLEEQDNPLLNFVNFFDCINCAQRHDIMKQNAKDIFNNPYFFNVNFCDSITRIHRYLLFGLYNTDGELSDYHFRSSKYRSLAKKVSKINDSKGDLNDYILVFLYYVSAQHFARWNEWVGSIWINYHLNTLFEKVIDWNQVKFSQFYKMFIEFQRNKKAKPLCNYLKGFLVPTCPEALYSYLGCEWWH